MNDCSKCVFRYDGSEGQISASCRHPDVSKHAGLYGGKVIPTYLLASKAIRISFEAPTWCRGMIPAWWREYMNFSIRGLV
jgi:hypothetical protein